jgi:predicted alpha/beta hydrolase
MGEFEETRVFFGRERYLHGATEDAFSLSAQGWSAVADGQALFQAPATAVGKPPLRPIPPYGTNSGFAVSVVIFCGNR